MFEIASAGVRGISVRDLLAGFCPLHVVGVALIACLSIVMPARAQTVVNGMTINSWGYQLQNDSTAPLVASPYDVLVIDYSKSSGVLTQAEVAAMKKKPDGSRRLVISYISIGEAESYRYYWGDRAWQDRRNRLPPVAAENPEWKGNFTVQFWEQEWQNLILFDRDSYINRIIDLGFDGIYLDKVDIVDDLKGKTPPGTEASDLMTQFIRKMNIVTKRRNPNFMIIAQNAEGLLDDPNYRAVIDGIGKESLLYSTGFFDEKNNYQSPKRNSESAIKWSTDRIKKLREEGKLVMVVEYIRERDLIERSTAELTKNGFIPYFGPRDLSYLSYTKETNNN